jgi:hypothetical protein
LRSAVSGVRQPIEIVSQAEKRVRLRHVAMGVQVNGPNALSVDNDLPSPRRFLRERGAQQAASDRRKPG